MIKKEFAVVVSGIVLVVAIAARGQNDSAPSSLVRKMTTITEQGGRLDWSAARNLIAFDRFGPSGYFDTWLMNPDGSNQRCITCNKPGIPHKSNGNPAWHPSGNFLVIQVQNQMPEYQGQAGKILDFYATPGVGFNDDLWITDPDGARFTRVTEVPRKVGGILHPQFSHKGDRLLWAERIDRDPNGMRNRGEWALKIAEFHANNGVPSISNVKTMRPGKNPHFFETHDFSPDDRYILYCADSDSQVKTGLDIYRTEVATGATINLTNTPDEWDEHAHYSPSGQHIIWMSSSGNANPFGSGRVGVAADYWIMDADGSNKRRLTYFNKPGHKESVGAAVSNADFAWGPTGDRFMGYQITMVKRSEGRIVLFELTGAQ